MVVMCFEFSGKLTLILLLCTIFIQPELEPFLFSFLKITKKNICNLQFELNEDCKYAKKKKDYKFLTIKHLVKPRTILKKFPIFILIEN